MCLFMEMRCLFVFLRSVFVVVFMVGVLDGEMDLIFCEVMSCEDLGERRVVFVRFGLVRWLIFWW